jgi:hypothetical protein
VAGMQRAGGETELSVLDIFSHTLEDT